MKTTATPGEQWKNHKIEFSEWRTPIVPVVKKNGEIRLCADYKEIVNNTIKANSYPVPTVHNIFARMSVSKYFITLELHQSYLYMEVDENTSILQSINTLKGTYNVTRLLYDIKAAPKIWQRFMDSILLNLDGVSSFLSILKYR